MIDKRTPRDPICSDRAPCVSSHVNCSRSSSIVFRVACNERVKIIYNFELICRRTVCYHSLSDTRLVVEKEEDCNFRICSDRTKRNETPTESVTFARSIGSNPKDQKHDIQPLQKTKFPMTNVYYTCFNFDI